MHIVSWFIEYDGIGGWLLLLYIYIQATYLPMIPGTIPRCLPVFFFFCLQRLALPFFALLCCFACF
ncbi:hypothetical protein GGR50DRAFT_658657 [Xylaria sp. CBS 124048]|nr:hypothetical protein GGR50DRAFT_658657 [Xylaria sp. CBS 124048]